MLWTQCCCWRSSSVSQRTSSSAIFMQSRTWVMIEGLKWLGFSSRFHSRRWKEETSVMSAAVDRRSVMNHMTARIHKLPVWAQQSESKRRRIEWLSKQRHREKRLAGRLQKENANIPILSHSHAQVTRPVYWSFLKRVKLAVATVDVCI